LVRIILGHVFSRSCFQGQQVGELSGELESWRGKKSVFNKPSKRSVAS